MYEGRGAKRGDGQHIGAVVSWRVRKRGPEQPKNDRGKRRAEIDRYVKRAGLVSLFISDAVGVQN